MSHYAVAGLGYGDEGKGATVDHICRSLAPHQKPWVVRYNGGPQAGHNVVWWDGELALSHTFSQWGSGTAAGAPTWLSRFCLVNPLNMLREASHLAGVALDDPWETLRVDPDCLVVTPMQVAVGRMRELARGEGRHGSCGMGVGETVADSLEFPDAVLRASDLLAPERKLQKLSALKREQAWEMRREAEWDSVVPERGSLGLEYRHVAKMFRFADAEDMRALLHGQKGTEPVVVFEGAQGVLLDERYGFYPHTTWSDTTFRNAVTLTMDLRLDRNVETLGVIRAYSVRHGPGPFVPGNSLVGRDLARREMHNETGRWQGAVRTGAFDFVAFHYALEVLGGVSGVAVTCMDTVGSMPTVRAYDVGSHLGALDSLSVPREPSLEERALLGRTLMGAKPLMSPELTPAGLLDRIDAVARRARSSSLHPSRPAGVVMVSRGPTADDRQVAIGPHMFAS